MIDLLVTLYRLKDEERAGWVLRGVERPESVADHSWGTALLCLLFAPAAGIDVSKAVSIALVHDLAESLTGDSAARGGLDADPEKKQRELEAFGRLFPEETSDSGRIRGLWNDYERRETAEARFVRDMNLIDMCLQALIYESERRYESPGLARHSGETEEGDRAEERPAGRLVEFFETTRWRLSTPTGKELFEQLNTRFRELGRQQHRPRRDEKRSKKP